MTLGMITIAFNYVLGIITLLNASILNHCEGYHHKITKYDRLLKGSVSTETEK